MILSDPCTNERRFCNIEEDIRELKDQNITMLMDISSLKEDRAETRVYVKQIFERLDDLKEIFQSESKSKNINDKFWGDLVYKLIAVIITISLALAGLKSTGYL